MNETSAAAAELAPHGVLRAGINLSNFLLVTGRTPAGDPAGVAPDMARAIADRLGVPVRYVPYPKPGELADAAGTDAWDIGLIGAEPARAEKIEFTPAYVEIQSTYLVPPARRCRASTKSTAPASASPSPPAPPMAFGSTATSARPNSSIPTTWTRPSISSGATGLMRSPGSVPGSWPTRNAGRVRASSPASSPPCSRPSAPCDRTRPVARFLRAFAAEAVRSGLVARLIEQHRVQGLSVAPEFRP